MRRWTSAEDSLLVRLAHTPYPHLATLLGRSRSSIDYRIGRLGLRWQRDKRRPSPDEEATLRRMHAAGCSDRQIAGRLHQGRRRVACWRAYLRLSNKRAKIRSSS